MAAWLLSLPDWSLAIFPVGALSAIGLTLFLAARAELAIRAGRHRGKYDHAAMCVRSKRIEAGKPTVTTNLVGDVVWEGQVFFGAHEPAGTVAALTFAPTGGVMTLPALMGPPSEPMDPDEFEALLADVQARNERERFMEIERVVQLHERLYHPVAA